jgi:hypothetical protein
MDMSEAINSSGLKYYWEERKPSHKLRIKTGEQSALVEIDQD